MKALLSLGTYMGFPRIYPLSAVTQKSVGATKIKEE
jgi:hypothetical protein